MKLLFYLIFAVFTVGLAVSLFHRYSRAKERKRLANNSISYQPDELRSLGSSDCEDDGIFAHPKDCTQYYQCIDFDGKWIFVDHRCAPGGYFNKEHKVCVYGSCPYKNE